jgi:hypothetical protein
MASSSAMPTMGTIVCTKFPTQIYRKNNAADGTGSLIGRCTQAKCQTDKNPQLKMKEL